MPEELISRQAGVKEGPQADLLHRPSLVPRVGHFDRRAHAGAAAGGVHQGADGLDIAAVLPMIRDVICRQAISKSKFSAPPTHSTVTSWSGSMTSRQLNSTSRLRRSMLFDRTLSVCLETVKEVYKARVSTLVRVSPEMQQGLCVAGELNKNYRCKTHS